MLREVSNRNGPYLYSKWSWYCTDSCFSFCFLWQCFVLLVCYRGHDGTCPHIVCLTPGLCTVQSALWEYFRINVRIVQTDLKCGVFTLKQVHRILLWIISPDVFWAACVNADLPSALCTTPATQLDGCSAFGWCDGCFWFRVFFCLIVCFYFSWEELSLRVMKLWRKERRLQMISTSRLAGQLLPSPRRQSRIISNACWCSNTSVFPVWGRGWKNVCAECSKATSLTHPWAATFGYVSVTLEVGP